MNKIYKVIWSKVRNCYVAVSEIAKRNGKSSSVVGGVVVGNGAVNCGASENYGAASVCCGCCGLRMAAVTLGVAALVGGVGFGTPAAWADSINNNLSITTDVTVSVYGGKASSDSSGIIGGYYANPNNPANGNKVTVGAVEAQSVFGGYSEKGVAYGNKVFIEGSTISAGYAVYGGLAMKYPSANTVTITGGTVGGSVYGGSLIGGEDAENVMYNNVEISEGTIGSDGTKVVVGGDSSEGKGEASQNIVTVSGGTVNASVYGGYSSSGRASRNTVTISKTDTTVPNINGIVYGGYSQSGTAGGEDTDTDPYQNGNKVNISGGTVNYWVYGGCSDSGAARYNTIEISGGTITNMVYGGRGATDTTGNKVTIKGGKFDPGEYSKIEIYGGFTDLEVGITSVAATGNAVTIEGGDFKNTAIYGGYTQGHNASGNAVTISTINNGALGEVYGGYVDNNSGTAGDSAAGNVVTINGGVVELVYGGLTQIGTAGGVSTSDDPYENGNKVTITGGEVGTVFGGSSNNGTASNNQVSISGGTVNSMVYGGEASTDTTGNKVAISGGKVNATVYGGKSAGSGAAKNNIVEISGGEVNATVYGGFSESGKAENNTVEISGGNFKNNLTIYGGKGVEANNNTVEISVANFKAASICVGDGATSTGNTLVLGAKGLEVTGAQGVGGVQIIALTDKVQFENNTTVLKADKFSKDSKTAANAANFDGTLDISAATGLQGATAPGVMTLLQSDTENNFTTLDLKYKDATGSEQTANLSGETTSQIVWEGAAQENEKIGVKLVYRNTHTVSVAAGGKTITYNIANPVGDVTLGSIDWVKGGTARTLTAAEKALLTVNGKTAVNAADLTFTGTIHENPLNQSMTLLAGATGITGDHITQAGEGKGEIAVAYTDAKGIALNARAKGEVSVASGSVKYTINRVALDKATLGSLAWGDTDSLPESWQASGTTQIDDTNFAYTGTASTALKAGSTATILTAPGLLATSPVTVGTVEGKTVDVNYTDDAGVSYTATASGHVAAAKGAVNYVVDSVAATGVNLQSWNGKDASTAITTNGWTGTGVAVATGSFAAPTDLNLGETRTITAAPTGFFGTVTGSNAYPSNGGTLSEDTGGVKLAGSMIGGVKAEDDGTTATLTYYAMKKTADTMTLGTFAFVDGDANARTYGKEYDLTNAEITTDGLAFTEESKKAMETGNKMTLVDASGAYKNGGAALKALSSGAKTSFAVAFTDTIEGKGITFAGTHTDTLALADDSATNTKQSKLIYTVGDKNVSTATLSGGIAWSDGVTHYTNKNYKFDGNTKVNVGVNFTATADPLNTSMTLIGSDSAEHAVKGTISGTPGFTVTMNNTTLDATVTGAASIESGNLKYTVTGVTLNKVTVDGVGSDAVPEGWSAATDVQVDTDSMTVPSDAAYGQPQSIMTSDKPVFDDNNITGSNKYAPAAFTDTDSKETPAVTVAGTQNAGVKASADKKSLVYEVGKKEASAITLGAVTWAAGAELMDGSKEEYDYSSVKSVDAGSFVVKFDAPENVDASKGESMTLLQANDTLADMAEQEKKQEYKIDPVSGVHIDAMITGKLAAKNGAVTFTAAENNAGSLNFGKVEWTGDTPLIDHSKTLKNVSFNGATVDTSNIDFYKEMYIEADQTTTLVSDFGGTPGEIKGTKYMVGTAFEGESETKLEGGNLILRTKTAAGVSEQTHKAVMGVEATMGLLAGATGHMDKVMDGLGNTANAGPDGTSTSASVGGGKDRYETGSHVNVNSWSAAVGVGARKEMKKGTLQYGIFGEYGKGSYTMHSDVGRSDGDAHYAGGGLMAKWTNKHDVYTEASFRLGRVSDSANDLLRDGAGNAYGYDIHATYYGAHVGLGKIFNYKGGKSLDVYGKFFYTKRDGCEFDAKQHYNLDSVASSVLRIGARYGTNDKKWNWYGGLAYEYEFDGEAKGTVNGTEIRAASVKGSSVRGEFGLRMSATKTNPWQTDISIYGYGGKHRGFGGSVNVAYVF
ncbi:Extended Signal Peptide of Type V secretion system [Succiniclasticum ruminis]|uniref:Extended Signal Peptide of Type V secretion system n=1 Tax=Succiniclasticum ruminis TaxID=40841 RepID=A0A1G6KU39_9FIRM|nr:ESPR-type extended signal peptide-containing protein [Succiniclasticum ruminis]SDC34005.1 Extended Signal Peptide of Type V secretion system [Succiniclasticum ruminis]